MANKECQLQEIQIPQHEVYRNEAHTLVEHGEVVRALENYSKALQLKGDDVDCLAGRSQCYLKLGEHCKALEDADSALAISPQSNKGIYAKAEALYHKKEYELALVFYHRGNKLRGDLKEFEIGIQKAKDKIDKGSATPKRVSSRKDEKNASSSAEQKPIEKKSANRIQSTKGGLRKPSVRSEGNPSERQLLGELYGDRKFLEKLLSETDGISQNGKDISQLAYTGLHFLDKTSEFWREHNPKYSPIPGKSRVKSGKIHQQNILKQLVKIEEELNEENYDAAIKRSERALDFVQGFCENTIEYREEIIATLYTCFGIAHQELGNLAQAIDYHHKVLVIANGKELTDVKSRTLEYLGQVYVKSGDFSSAIEAWRDRETLCTSALESTWLCHEIGRCYMELQAFEKAVQYGEKSLEAANEASEETWKLSSLVLIAQSKVKLENYPSALEIFELALEVAKTSGDEKVVRALHRSLIETNKKMNGGREPNKELKLEISNPALTERNASRSPSLAESQYDDNTFESANDVTVTSDDS